jgi:HrpA-like RNA helicase
LATLPVEPHIGKLINYGALFGCVDPALTIAATVSSKSPFVAPFGCRELADEARQNFAVDGSDHLTILEAFNLQSIPSINIHLYIINFMSRLLLIALVVQHVV